MISDAHWGKLMFIYKSEIQFQVLTLLKLGEKQERGKLLIIYNILKATKQENEGNIYKICELEGELQENVIRVQYIKLDFI